MKITSSIISILSLVAVAVLYVLHFTGSKLPLSDAIQEEGAAESKAKSLKIAYVKADSIIRNYDLAQDLHDEFTKRQEAYNTEYGNKRKSFEDEAAAFQEKLQRGGFLTEQRAIQERDRLLGKEQEISQLDQELSSKLTEMQTANNKQILDSLLNYLEKLNKTKQYDYILNGANVLLGNEENNLTADVLKALNKRYSKDSNE
jgi:outer membrane protein